MIFAILFIIAFLFGLIIYAFSRQWMWAVAIPMVLFTLNAILDDEAVAGSLLFTLVFGLTIVFFASLLGAYVVQIRSPDEPEQNSVSEGIDH